MDAPDRLDLLEQLRVQPGGEQLLAVATPAAFLVGGAVRDLLLGRAPRELDVVVEGGGQDLATALGARVAHPRFGTASVELAGGARIDIAAARRELYPAPGALPEVEPAPLAEDLLRRDFTVNAIAIALGGERPGELRAASAALEDLRARRLRVLHERSFLDDPTRLLRLARYRARLGFATEERTAALAQEALAAGALGTVSGARIGAELRLALAEHDSPAALAELDRLGVLRALHPRLRFEPALVRRALALLPLGQRSDPPPAERHDGGQSAVSSRAEPEEDGQSVVSWRVEPEEDDRPDLLLLAALALPLALRAGGDHSEIGRRGEIAALLDRLEFPAGERDRVAAAAAAVPRLIEELPAAASPSQLRTAALPAPAEGVALAGAVSAPAADPARRWLTQLRRVRLRISGADLIAAGIPEGPEIGRRLAETLRMRLDGELPDERTAQLRAALELR